MQWLMGNTQTRNKVNFDDIRFLIKQSKHTSVNIILISTLPEGQQDCLIKGTTPCYEEVSIINQCIQKSQNSKIIVYGKNSNDETVHKKYEQLRSLGFTDVYLFVGGLFEWLMLQDIYGDDEFPTTKKNLDILKYRPVGIFTENRNLLLREE
tara:strand:+ start:2453 stop:2908 length:456 start_codon:yes stop_codon:yes gene_type:complete